MSRNGACAEQAAVLPAELGWALIADLKRCGCRILIFGEHQPPRFVQTQPFLVLQRAHGRQRPKMMMEGRCTHIDLRCEVIDTQRPCEVTFQPIDCPCYLLALASRRGHLAQTSTLIAHKQTVKNFPLDDRRKDRNILRLIKQSDQPLKGGEQWLR